MLKQKRSRQIWWPVYGLALLMVGLLFLAHNAAPSPGWRTFLDISVVLGGYGLITFWLETNSTPLLDQSVAGTDNPSVTSPESGIIPPARSSHVRCQFYIGSDPAIIYRMPDQPSTTLRSNGHSNPARAVPLLPEKAGKQFSKQLR